jgi:dTDP-4-amino-4,6-dideoxygalactose transaminase
MKVPLLDVRRQNEPLAGELCEAFARVLHSGQYILGKQVEDFEHAVAAVAGTRHAIAVSSGTDAILLALMALDIGPGDEVICPSFTFFATGGCIARVGARPVFADSCPVCFNLDPESFARAITPRTKAVIPVHLFGQMAHMDEVLAIAGRHGLDVIEDAAQSLGAAYQGRPAGSLGAFGAFSFYPTKNLGALGDAGMLVTSDDALAARARLLRVHGAEAQYFHKMVGANFRMDALQAALLAVKLPHLADYTAARAAHAAAYTAALQGVRLPATHAGHTHIWNQYTVCTPQRDALKSWLAARGIGAAIYYPLPLHLQECFARSGPHAPLPVCERLAAQCLSLPVYAELTAAERECVIAAIGEFVQRQSGCQ